MTQLKTGHSFSVEGPTGRNADVQQGPFLSALLLALRGRRLIAAIVVLVPVIVLTVALLSPRTYAATASFVPEGRKGSSVTSGLAAELGVSVDGGDASDSPAFYVELLSSREILNAVLDSVHVATSPSAKPIRLLDYYVPNNRDTTRQRASGIDSLRRAINASPSRKTGVVTLTVSSRRPALAQAIAQRMIDELSRFNLERRQSKASAERRFTGARFDEVRTDLRVAEDRLQEFLQRNRGGSSPDLEFQKDRLSREVQLRQSLYTTLAQAFEQARIDEVRDTPVLTIIEHPTYPPRPESRHIVSNLVLATIAGLFIGFVIALLRDRFTSLEERDRNSRQELTELWQMTKGDLSHLGRMFTRRGSASRSA